MSTATVTADTAPAPRTHTPIYKSLFAQVVFALILGVVLGMAAP